MASYDYAGLFGENFKNNFLSNNNLPFDFQALLETQRRNLQAFTEAQQLALDGFQAVAQRQTELLSQLVQDNSALAAEVLGEGTPEEKVAKQADIVKKVYEKSVTSWRELADMLSESNTEAAEIINKRVSASLNEFKAALKNKESGAPRKKAA